MRFRIYVDEVGNPDLDSSDNPNHRFLSLTGVIIEMDHVKTTIHPEMEARKKEYFGYHPDEPVIFHRKEMINFKPPFEVLNDAEVREKFDHNLLELLKKWEYTVITVCIDKKKHKETYRAWRYDPYHYCLEIPLERFIFFLNRQQSKGDMLAESRGGKEDLRLKDAYERLWNYGTEYL